MSTLATESHSRHGGRGGAHAREPARGRPVVLDLSDGGGSCVGVERDCVCERCAGPGHLLGSAACVMVDASSSRTKPKTMRERVGAQALHWGVLFVAILMSMPVLVPMMGDGLRAWARVGVLAPVSSTAIGLAASALFAFGFVSKLGVERVRGGCAMIRRLGPAAVLGVAWSTLPSFAGVLLVLNMEPIRLALVGAEGSALHLATGVVIYGVAFIVLAGLGCLPTVSQAILAGYAFGLPIGLGAALIGFGGASLVGYELVRRLAAPRVEFELASSRRAMMIRDALLGASAWRALLIVSLIRMSPTTPFALTNLLLGSLGVSRRVFFFGTMIGMTPRTLAAVLIGLSFTGWRGGFDHPAWLVALGLAALVTLVVVLARVSAGVLSRLARDPEGGRRRVPAGAGAAVA